MYLLLCNVLLFCFCVHRSWLEHGFNVPRTLYVRYTEKHNNNIEMGDRDTLIEKSP